MVDQHHTQNSESIAGPTEKKQYSHPVLLEFGSVKQLTRGGPHTRVDGAQGEMGDRGVGDVPFD